MQYLYSIKTSYFYFYRINSSKFYYQQIMGLQFIQIDYSFVLLKFDIVLFQKNLFIANLDIAKIIRATRFIYLMRGSYLRSLQKIPFQLKSSRHSILAYIIRFGSTFLLQMKISFINLILLFQDLSMKKSGRSTDSALNRTAVNKKLQTFSHKRLFKDLQEIQRETIPTIGVIARPLDNDLFTWHGNVKGPEGTFYEGGVFHIELKFPQSYPHHPPTVTLFNTIPHPNVFGSYICLDMIQQFGNTRKQQGAGWTSAYSVQSILTQLQSFLFQQNLNKDKAALELQVKKAVKEANSFKCRNCKHGGKLSCWPAFAVKEPTIQQFSTLDEQNELIQKQLVCFHTKLNYKQNQLGFGLKISKIPRTGNIRQGETYFDYISLKAFIKQSMNLTSNNERITHWLPVYFGKGDNQEKFLHCLKKSLSMIMTNSTKYFEPQFILEVFPKLMITTVYYLMDQKKHSSIRAIRILTHLHSMFLFCIKKFPNLTEKIAEQIKKFLTSEQNRHKNVQTNLGCILVYLSAIDAYKFSDIAETYFSQQLDRQVLWILKSVPQLINDDMMQEADKLRSKIVFKSQTTSFHMLCFYKLFLTQICQTRKSRSHMCQQYQSNLCKLSNKEQNQFQRQIFEIPKKVSNFQEFFKYVGLKEQNQEQILKLLKSSIKNSQRKKYHGKFQVIHELPSTGQQLKKIHNKLPSYDKFIKVTTQKTQEGDKQAFKFIIKEEKSVQDDWKTMCFERWAWVREALSYDSTLTANKISVKALQYAKQGISKAQDRLSFIMKEVYLNGKINYNEPTINLPEMNWKQIFLRLDLEDFLFTIDMNTDFPSFYQKLQVCKNSNVSIILISMIQINNIKSGFYYLTALLSKLTTLKCLQFSGLPQMNNVLNQKAAKAIKKGFSNFREAGGKLDIISFYNITVNKDLSDCLFGYLSQTDSITSLRFKKTNIFNYGNTMKVLSNYLANLKNVQQIVFDNCNLDQSKCKILADSLMRMKQLKIFQIHDTLSLGSGLSAIIYNLAFSPNMLKLDISRTNIGSNATQINETVVSLQKLLKISASIQVLKVSNISSLNPALTKQFWVSLGQCRSLRVLDTSYSGDLSIKKTQIGQAIAFNAKKKGSLEYLNLTGTFNGSYNLNQLYTGMNISEYDQQLLYGDPNKLSKMIASNYKKVYYNNLKALQLNQCNNMNPNFSLAHFNKLVTKNDPQYVKLFSESPNLESLMLSQTGLNKNIADVLVLALDPRRPNFCSKIQVLNLAKNNLGKQGMKILAEVLPHNNILQVLDLSKNFLGVSGAYQLSTSLKDNKSLKYLNLFNNKIGYDGAKAVSENIVRNSPSLQLLEIGHNRIRDKGLKSIVDSLILNKSSKLKILCLRFNFITNLGATYLLNKISGNVNNLQQIFIRNNLLDDLGINNLDSIHTQEKSKVSIDLLQKVKYLDQDKSDRTIWIHPIANINLQKLKKFFEITYKCGIVLDLRVRLGRKYPNKNQQNRFGFVEFADQTSVTRSLHLAASKLTQIDGIKFRIYKAGTGTFLYQKKTAKQRKLQVAKNCLPPVPYAIQATLERNSMPMPIMRGRGRGRGRGGFGRPTRQAPKRS